MLVEVLVFLRSAMSFLIVVWELDSSCALNSVDNSIKPELCQSDLKHFIIFNYSFYVYMYTHHSVCVEIRDKLGESILSFTVLVSGVKFGLSGLAATVFTH